MESAPINVAIVPHTHWDREWYLPFQRYRLKLVRLLDSFLSLLEADPSYTHFTLDGQTAVIDDYLAMRPSAAVHIRDLVASGRMSIGPWAVLMDEYMVSAETIVRNLQAGLVRSAEFGGAMDVAYLPDMFGHIAQMPQLLRLAEFDDTVLWRGVPSQVTQTGFDWISPDGSAVRAEFLFGSYSNGRDLADDPALLVQRAESYIAELGDAWLGSDLLLMNGTDHQVPQPWLGEIVQEANRLQDRFQFRITSLAEYLSTQPRDNLIQVRGELRSGAQSNVLMGVASNRVDVHQATAVAERRLERIAEPLWSALLPAPWPRAELDEAWRFLILNAAHDSSCACSDDEVVDEVMVRYRSARQIADGLVEQGLELLSLAVDAQRGDHIVVNTTPRSRSEVVEVIAPGEGTATAVGYDGQVLTSASEQHPARQTFSAVVEGTKIGWVLEMLRGTEFAGRPVASWRIARTSGLSAGVSSPDPGSSAGATEELGLDAGHTSPEAFHAGDEADVAIVVAAPGSAAVDTAPLRDALAILAGNGVRMKVSSFDPPFRTVKVWVPDVPGFGWTTVRIATEGRSRDQLGDGHGQSDAGQSPGALTEGGAGSSRPGGTAITLSNEFATVTVDPATGDFSLAQDALRCDGLGRIVEGGDGGDTYNYSPPSQDRIIDVPATVTVGRLNDDGLAQHVEVIREYDWRAWGRDSTTIRQAVTTRLELRRGEPFLRVSTTIDNRSADHRIRTHFPLPGTATGSQAECAFTVVERGLSAEGGLQEVGLPTFVSRRFVDVQTEGGSLLVVHDGLYEYEITENGRELALTLLRATGWLARREPDFRPNPAGPQIPVVGAQMTGVHTLRYALALHLGDWESADAYALADRFLVPLQTVVAQPVSHSLTNHGQNLRVDGGCVSAITRESGALVLRLFNPTGHPVTTRLDWRDAPLSGWTINLRGRPLQPFDGAVDLGPHQVLTVRAEAPF
jgi:hypothetical protein